MPFFDDALAAAKINPEAFAAEFQKPEADANAREHVFKGQSIGDFLIHALIESIDDINLPPLLKILIQHNVDLEKENLLGCRPLALACYYVKPLAVNFLLAQPVILHQTLKQPALCSLASSPGNPEKIKTSLSIIKTLIEEHKVDINVQNKDGFSVLHEVAQKKYLNIIEYLIAQEKINLFLHTKSRRTALGIAYEEYISSRKSFPDNDNFTINSKACFDLLLKAVYQYLYKKAVRFQGSEEELNKELDKDLAIVAGNNNSHIYPEANSINLKKLLDVEILIPLLERVKLEREQRFAVCLGATRRITNPTMHAAFFGNPLFDKNALATIFSFTHEITPTPVNEPKETSTAMQIDNTLTLR